MVFSSIPFLYYFLPAVILSYFILSTIVEKCFFLLSKNSVLSHKAGIFSKNLILLLFSLLFYAWGEPVMVFLMLITILVFWGCGLAIGKAESQKMKKFWLILSAVFGIGLLLYYKYTNFFIDSILNKIPGVSLKLLKIVMPIGISFYTFQSMSYTIDVYRGDVEVQKNPLYFGTYVALFPQLIAGPIVRYVDVAREINDRTHSFEQFRLGVRRFVIGLSKKILITNNLAKLIEIFRASNEQSVLFYWIYAIAFMLSLYFDFSAYSDMAIGMGKMFGFQFIENFNHPYMSKSIGEFWRRWHMSLGSWFRDYVYIPLGGNRVGKFRWLFNTFAVWFLTGMWHGASWNFILWGLLYAVCLVVEKWVPAIQKIPAVLRHFGTMLLVTLGFVLFNAADMAQVVNDFTCLFGFGGLPFFSRETLYYLVSYGTLFVMGIVGCTPLVKTTCEKLCAKKGIGVAMAAAQGIVLIALLVLCTAFLVDGSFSPFLYFRF